MEKHDCAKCPVHPNGKPMLGKTVYQQMKEYTCEKFFATGVCEAEKQKTVVSIDS